jgi:hypothetical protein
MMMVKANKDTEAGVMPAIDRARELEQQLAKKK